jgi:hypothetical protein
MDPIEIRRSVASQIAAHYLANYEEIGAKSVKELALLYTVSEPTAHQALRIVDEHLAADGKTLLIPEGRKAWRVEPTASEREMAVSARGRLTAIAHELDRYRRKGAATSDRDPAVSRAFEDCTVAVSLAVESLTVIAP